jgi:hypothetical protein
MKTGGLRQACPGSTATSGLQEAIREQFNAIRTAPTALYDRLACVIRPGDAVITFNYDQAVERALRAVGLWDLKTGYGFPIEDGATGSRVEVLKLHGSTNWRALLHRGFTEGYFAGNGNSIGDRPVFPFRPDLEYLGYPDFTDPGCRGLDIIYSDPALILPALPKQFFSIPRMVRNAGPFGTTSGGAPSALLRTPMRL